MSELTRFLDDTKTHGAQEKTPMQASLLANVTAWIRQGARVLGPGLAVAALSVPGTPVLADGPTSQAPGYPAYVTRDAHAMASNYSEPGRQTWIDDHTFRGLPPNTPVRVRAYGLLRAADADINADTWIDLAFRVNGNDNLQPIFEGARMSSRPGPRTFDTTFTTSTNDLGELRLQALVGQCTLAGHDPRCGVQPGDIEIEVIAPQPR